MWLKGRLFQIWGRRAFTTEDTESTEKKKVDKRKTVSGPLVFLLHRKLCALCALCGSKNHP
jgi:hypothetical protein